MPRIIILGDVHLGKGINIGKIGVGAKLNSRIVDQLNLLNWVLDRAVANLVNTIIITGDIFDDPKPAISLISLFISWIKECKINNVNVEIIMGNHDAIRCGTTYTSPLDIIDELNLDNVNVYKNIDTKYYDNFAFTFFPFRDRKSFISDSNAEALSILKNPILYELYSIPKTYKKFLVGHIAIEGAIPIGDEFDDITNELFFPIDAFNGYDHVIMGHVHKPQVLAPNISHIGSMDISDFGETDQKKHIMIIDGDNISYEDLPTRKLKRISITIPKDTNDSTKYVLDELNKHDIINSIVKVEIALTNADLKSVNKSSIEKYLLSNGAFNISNISESRKINIVKKANTITTAMDINSIIRTYADTYVDEKMRSDFIDLSIKILTKFNTK